MSATTTVALAVPVTVILLTAILYFATGGGDIEIDIRST